MIRMEIKFRYTRNQEQSDCNITKAMSQPKTIYVKKMEFQRGQNIIKCIDKILTVGLMLLCVGCAFESKYPSGHESESLTTAYPVIVLEYTGDEAASRYRLVIEDDSMFVYNSLSGKEVLVEQTILEPWQQINLRQLSSVIPSRHETFNTIGDGAITGIGFYRLSLNDSLLLVTPAFDLNLPKPTSYGTLLQYVLNLSPYRIWTLK